MGNIHNMMQRTVERGVWLNGGTTNIFSSIYRFPATSRTFGANWRQSPAIEYIFNFLSLPGIIPYVRDALMQHGIPPHREAPIAGSNDKRPFKMIVEKATATRPIHSFHKTIKD